jgi:hypothetical protein
VNENRTSPPEVGKYSPDYNRVDTNKPSAVITSDNSQFYKDRFKT